MKNRFAFEIVGAPSAFCTFAYFDTGDHLADLLFREAGVDVEIREEFGAENDSYRVIEVRVPKNQRDQFLGCVDLLPGLMDYVGRTDYVDY